MSYYYYGNDGNRRGGFMSNVPTVTKNIIIINIIVFLFTWVLERRGSSFMNAFVLFDPSSHWFHFWQPVTYMFMHGGFWHILFNMYTLFIFGSVVERIIGSKKFLAFYLICGVGAAGFHLLVTSLLSGVSSPMVGASGAIYGVMLAYAMLFPDSKLTLIFPPVTLSAKWMVIVFAAIELLTGVTSTAEGIAHFAHLGGMIFGFLIIRFWKARGILFDKDKFI